MPCHGNAGGRWNGEIHGEYRGDEGDLFSFSVYLSQEDGGTLIFPNQMGMKWRRDPDAYVPWGILIDAERGTPASD